MSDCSQTSWQQNCTSKGNVAKSIRFLKKENMTQRFPTKPNYIPCIKKRGNLFWKYKNSGSKFFKVKAIKSSWRVNILLGFFLSVLICSLFLSTSGINQGASRSLFKTVTAHSELFYSCYINDSEHKGKVGYILILLDLNYFIPNFQVKLVCNPHLAAHI